MDGFATDSQGREQMSSGDPRTSAFHQTLVTVGDTACSVTEVLHITGVTHTGWIYSTMNWVGHFIYITQSAYIKL